MNSRHRRQHTGSRALFALALLWALVGCEQPLEGVDNTTLDSAVTEEPVEQPATPPPAPAPTPTLCGSDTVEAISSTITAQSLALGAGDFDTAYTFASPSFREAVSVDMFERVITRQYDMLLYFESASFGRCEVTSEDVASLPVEVRSEFYRPVVMTYEMVHVDGTWFVSAVDNPVSGVPNA